MVLAHFQWMASERLEIGGNASWLEAEVDKMRQNWPE